MRRLNSKSGNHRQSDRGAVERHLKHQHEMRHGQRLIPVLLARAALLVFGLSSILVGFYLLLWSASLFVIVTGIALLVLGVYLVLRGLLFRKVRLEDVLWWFPWFGG